MSASYPLTVDKQVHLLTVVQIQIQQFFTKCWIPVLKPFSQFFVLIILGHFEVMLKWLEKLLELLSEVLESVFVEFNFVIHLLAYVENLRAVFYDFVLHLFLE
jgi:hypothetical protein